MLCFNFTNSFTTRHAVYRERYRRVPRGQFLVALLGFDQSLALSNLRGDGKEGLDDHCSGNDHPQTIQEDNVHPQLKGVRGHHRVPVSIQIGRDEVQNGAIELSSTAQDLGGVAILGVRGDEVNQDEAQNSLYQLRVAEEHYKGVRYHVAGIVPGILFIELSPPVDIKRTLPRNILGQSLHKSERGLGGYLGVVESVASLEQNVNYSAEQQPINEGLFRAEQSSNEDAQNREDDERKACQHF